MWNLNELISEQEERKGLPEPFEYRYPETVDLDGHIFHHIYGGVYVAEKEFEVTYGEIGRLEQKYPGIAFWVNEDIDGYEMDEGKKADSESLIIDEETLATLCALNNYQFTKSYAELVEYDMPDCPADNRDDICGTVCIARSMTYSRINRYSYGLTPPEKLSYAIADLEGEMIEHAKVLLKTKYFFGKYGICAADYRPDEMAYAFPDENKRYHGYQKHIMVMGCIGYLAMPGIYYLEERIFIDERNFEARDWIKDLRDHWGCREYPEVYDLFKTETPECVL